MAIETAEGRRLTEKASAGQGLAVGIFTISYKALTTIIDAIAARRFLDFVS